MNTKGKGELTTAQQLGLTEKQFTINDIFYLKQKERILFIWLFS
jgi:hypothetical protein